MCHVTRRLASYLSAAGVGAAGFESVAVGLDDADSLEAVTLSPAEGADAADESVPASFALDVSSFFADAFFLPPSRKSVTYQPLPLS